MSHYTPIPLILSTCFFLCFAQAAMAEIVECVDSAGSITYTDVPCKAGEDAVRLGKSVDKVAIKEKLTTQQNKYSATQHVREAVGVDKPSAGNGLTTDMSTLKSARESMASMDRVSKLSRQQMFASSY
ncbi:MAG: DUF4124 domain-containing protein [Burkholderiaceae bacterium]